MKTIPGIVGPAVLVVATALVTWFVVAKSKPVLDLPNWRDLNQGFYGLVVTGRGITNIKDFEAALDHVIDADKYTHSASFCFCYLPNAGGDATCYAYGPGVKVDNGKPDISGQANCNKPEPSMSVLSHKVYSIRATDIQAVIDTIDH